MSEAAGAVSHRLAPFNPVTPDVIEALLSADCAGPALSCSSTEGRRPLFLDIGSGDGRLLEAVHARTGCLCCGVEYDESLHDKAVARLLTAPSPSSSAAIPASSSPPAPVDASPPHTLFCEDAVSFDYPGKLPQSPSVIYCYLVPAGMKMMRDTLVALLENAHREYKAGEPKPLLVTYIFSLPDADAKEGEGEDKADEGRRNLLHRVVRTSRGLPLHVYSLP